MSELVAVSGIIDWEELTGQSRIVVDLVSIPIFSAFAGLITNWTGVLMLFAPVRFSGFHMPGLKTLYPFLPRKIQILPIFAPGGVLGFQGFIPARAEKMASICVDKGLAKVGSIKDFIKELDPPAIAEHLAVAAKAQLRPMVDEVMRREHPELWADLPPQMKEIVYLRIEQQLPGIAHRAMEVLGENIDQLVDIKLLIVGYLRRNPGTLKEIIYKLGAPELKFMIRIGLLGFPLGLLLALYLHVHHDIPVIGAIPAWLVVLIGAAVVGVIVNIIAIKVVFTPGTPQPRYRYLWKQAKLAKRQHGAAAAFGSAIAYEMLTLPILANELLNGPRGDKTQLLIQSILEPEINRIIGPVKAMVRVAVGTEEFDRIVSSTGATAVEFSQHIVTDVAFAQDQARKIDQFATTALRSLPPDEFMDILFSAVEQDAWLLYAHGAVLGLVVGAAHILFFGA